MSTKMFYTYHPGTKEFIQPVVLDESPIDMQRRLERNEIAKRVAMKMWVDDEKNPKPGEPPPEMYEEEPTEFLIPSFCTDVEPPAFGADERPIFDETTKKWSVVKDYRNVRFFDVNSGEEVSGLKLGDTIPHLEEYTIVTPPSFEKGQLAVFKDGNWSVVTDLRGSIAYHKKNGEQIVVRELNRGELPEDLTLEVPFAAAMWDEKTNKWVEDPEATKELNNWHLGNQLSEIDTKKIRSLTELALATSDADKAAALNHLRGLDEQSAQLRAKLK